jgi:hypothetical protein
MDAKRMIFCSSTADSTAADQLLWDEIAEVHPYIKSFYVMTTGCPKTDFKHHHLVMQFSEEKHLDLSTLTEEFKTRWGLAPYQRALDRQKGECWADPSQGPPSDGGILHWGIPPIRLEIPMDIVTRMVPDPETYHMYAGCFNWTPPPASPKKSWFSSLFQRGNAIVAPS